MASRLFVSVAILSALAYLAFLQYLSVLTGTPAMAGSGYFALHYPLVGMSAVLMGLTVYSRRKGLSNRAKGVDAANGASSAAASVVGGVISCSCHTSLLLPLLSSVGLSTLAGIGVISSLVAYQLWILALSIVIQLLLIYRALGKIKRQGPSSGGVTLVMTGGRTAFPGPEGA